MNLRYLWRSLSLVFVLWFALSPALCYASETATTESAIQSDVPMLMSINPSEITSGYLETFSGFESSKTSDNSYLGFTVDSFHTYTPPFNETAEKTNNDFWVADKKDVSHQVHFRSMDKSSLIDEGDVIDFTFSGLRAYISQRYSWSLVNVGGGSSIYGEYFDESTIKAVHLSVFSVPNCNWSYAKTYDITDSLVINSTNDSYGIDLKDFTAPFDIYYIRLSFTFNSTADDLDSSKTHSGFNGWGEQATYKTEFVNSTFSIEVQDGNKGLLEGIIEWLRSIRDGIVNVKDGVTNVFNAITELPTKLWTAIENGLKGLFVPSETDITAMKDKWDTLLSDRFGVVYESGALLINIANSVQESSTKETISFPSVSYNFSGTEFTFGGYEVDVIPNGFEFLADILKGVIDIVCTLAFINAMRRKYDELMMR